MTYFRLLNVILLKLVHKQSARVKKGRKTSGRKPSNPAHHSAHSQLCYPAVSPCSRCSLCSRHQTFPGHSPTHSFLYTPTLHPKSCSPPPPLSPSFPSTSRPLSRDSLPSPLISPLPHPCFSQESPQSAQTPTTAGASPSSPTPPGPHRDEFPQRAPHRDGLQLSLFHLHGLGLGAARLRRGRARLRLHGDPQAPHGRHGSARPAQRGQRDERGAAQSGGAAPSAESGQERRAGGAQRPRAPPAARPGPVAPGAEPAAPPESRGTPWEPGHPPRAGAPPARCIPSPVQPEPNAMRNRCTLNPTHPRDPAHPRSQAQRESSAPLNPPERIAEPAVHRAQRSPSPAHPGPDGAGSGPRGSGWRKATETGQSAAIAGERAAPPSPCVPPAPGKGTRKADKHRI